MIRGRMLTNHLNGRRRLRFSATWGGMREAIRGQALWRYRKSGHAARHGYTTIMGSEELRHYDYETA